MTSLIKLLDRVSQGSGRCCVFVVLVDLFGGVGGAESPLKSCPSQSRDTFREAFEFSRSNYSDVALTLCITMACSDQR